MAGNMDLAPEAETRVSQLTSDMGAVIEQGSRYVHSAHELTFRFSTHKYNKASAEVTVSGETPQAERKITFHAMAKNRHPIDSLHVVAAVRGGEHFLSCEIVAPNGEEIHVSESGIKSAFASGIPVNVDEIHCPYALELAKKVVDAQRAVAGSGKGSAWSVICDELRGQSST